MRTFVRHEVTFIEIEGDVLPSEQGYARLQNVTVRLENDKTPQVSASGRRCKKNGDDDGRLRGGNVWGYLKLPVEMEAEWVARAAEYVHAAAVIGMARLAPLRIAIKVTEPEGSDVDG